MFACLSLIVSHYRIVVLTHTHIYIIFGQSAIHIFAHSDIDDIEKEQMVEKIHDADYSKGHVFGKKGDTVVPALYIIRAGSVVGTKRFGCILLWWSS